MKSYVFTNTLTLVTPSLNSSLKSDSVWRSPSPAGTHMEVRDSSTLPSRKLKLFMSVCPVYVCLCGVVIQKINM